MRSAEIKTFKSLVQVQLVKKYHINETTARRAVRDSYLSSALKKDTDFVMHDTVEEWADIVYGELREAKV